MRSWRRLYSGVMAASAIALCAGCGDSFHEHLADARALLEAGDPAAALDAYRELQVEHPDSEPLLYSIACAQSALAWEAAEAKRPSDETAALFRAAADSFRRVRTSRNREIRERAGYNMANSVAQSALSTAQGAERKTAVAVIEESLREYEAFLDAFPDHRDALHNLDYMRYHLKQALQEPPEKKPAEPSEDLSNPSDPEHQPTREPAQQEDREEMAAAPGQEEELEQLAQPDESEAPSASQRVRAMDQDTRSEPRKGRETIEAILQSIEELDRREQREKPRGEIAEHGPREWW